MTVEKAVPVWGTGLKNQYSQFLGFLTELRYTGRVTVSVAARSYYRLYLNHRMICSGPARTAHRHVRVDRITLELSGTSQLAFEVAALRKLETYCNDNTMEPGLFLCEITDGEGKVLSATGDPSWRYTELLYRRSLVETMSHSRGILEYYDLTPDSFAWRGGEGNWQLPVPIAETVTLLPRHSRYPDYHRIPLSSLTWVEDMEPEGTVPPRDPFFVAIRFNPGYYAMIPDENRFVRDLVKEKGSAFTGVWERLPGNRLSVTPGKRPAAVTFENRNSELGFLDFSVSTEKECVLDILNTDSLNDRGEVPGNPYVTRYHLAPGSYHLTTFEPKLVRYLKMIFRTEGNVVTDYPVLLDDSYPDTQANTFRTSDGDLNRLFDAARRTLRLNTLDIFMDCPERERGGWLCDSQFTSAGSWMLFGDAGVERDFLENFLLTDPDVIQDSFFPEVYPGSHHSPEQVGIPNWSFWLVTELCDYYHRTGDREFVNRYKGRISRFIEGLLSLRGESGLLENLKNSFVDWSLSNSSYVSTPISVPNNCLAVCLLEKAAELYNEPVWAEEARRMRQLIEGLPEKMSGDAAVLRDGRLVRTGFRTEAGIALELWSGFHREDRAFVKHFVSCCGADPVMRADPYIGKSNLFIGLMIRYEVLARLGFTEELLRELRKLYLEEFKNGSGTLFESVSALSGCHGFNADVGAFLMNLVLGLSAPENLTKTVRISPAPGDLRYASGSFVTEEGTIFLRWNADSLFRKIDIQVSVPEGWHYLFERSAALDGWEVLLNGKTLN